MKEVILTMPIMVKDDFDGEDLAIAAHQLLEDGWRFDKAQMVVVDRPDVADLESDLWSTIHQIVVHPEAKKVREQFNPY